MEKDIKIGDLIVLITTDCAWNYQAGTLAIVTKMDYKRDYFECIYDAEFSRTTSFRLKSVVKIDEYYYIGEGAKVQKAKFILDDIFLSRFANRIFHTEDEARGYCYRYVEPHIDRVKRAIEQGKNYKS